MQYSGAIHGPGMRTGTPTGGIQGLPDSSLMAGKLHWFALEQWA
jgi:hypothetical protein